jgi:hypothetical protein
MIDTGLIAKCADPTLPPAIVEQFVATAGADDPFSITIKMGGRLLLVPKARTPADALRLAKQYVGHANVRIGVTQFPLDHAKKGRDQLDENLTDICENIRLGTALFAKVARIVTRWYGSPTNDEVLPQMFEDAVYAWKTGEFEGISVFDAPDPGGATFVPSKTEPEQNTGETHAADLQAMPGGAAKATTSAVDVEGSDIRIDLSRIGVRP